MQKSIEDINNEIYLCQEEIRNIEVMLVNLKHKLYTMKYWSEDENEVEAMSKIGRHSMDWMN